MCRLSKSFYGIYLLHGAEETADPCCHGNSIVEEHVTILFIKVTNPRAADTLKTAEDLEFNLVEHHTIVGQCGEMKTDTKHSLSQIGSKPLKSATTNAQLVRQTK